ncbi:hypothetical protein PF006_g30746, partial [Phytophthora fragariae]
MARPGKSRSRPRATTELVTRFRTPCPLPPVPARRVFSCNASNRTRHFSSQFSQLRSSVLTSKGSWKRRARTTTTLLKYQGTEGMVTP